MVNLRCSKCGSDSGFLIETSDGKVLEINTRLPLERIVKSVHVTCTYCNTEWPHVPITVQDSKLMDSVAEKAPGRRVTA